MLQAYQKASRMSSKPASWRRLTCRIQESETASLPLYGKHCPHFPIFGGLESSEVLHCNKKSGGSSQSWPLF